jgi:hypothetical protein
MKKLVIHLLFYSILFIVLITSSCKPKGQETICTAENSILFPQDAKDRFFFKDSSYWVYKDSITGAEDSIWTYNNSRLSIVDMEKMYSASKGKCYEGGTCFFNSLLSGKFSMIFNPIASPLGTPYSKEVFSLEIEQPGNIVFFFTSLRGNNYSNAAAEDHGSVDTIASLTIQNKTFNDVLRKTNSGSMYPDMFNSSYYVKHVGLVKFVRNDKSVWELVRYKTKQ